MLGALVKVSQGMATCLGQPFGTGVLSDRVSHRSWSASSGRAALESQRARWVLVPM